jgi:hypothetical protein
MKKKKDNYFILNFAKAGREFMRDLMDGYFPSELQV